MWFWGSGVQVPSATPTRRAPHPAGLAVFAIVAARLAAVGRMVRVRRMMDPGALEAGPHPAPKPRLVLPRRPSVGLPRSPVSAALVGLAQRLHGNPTNPNMPTRGSSGRESLPDFRLTAKAQTRAESFLPGRDGPASVRGRCEGDSLCDCSSTTRCQGWRPEPSRDSWSGSGGTLRGNPCGNRADRAGHRPGFRPVKTRGSAG